MDDLTFKEREFVALGAALGSNCTPCVEHHIGEARKAGLTDAQITAAVELADKVRKIPAAKALTAALTLLGETAASDTKATGCEQVMASKAPGCCN
jgi:4-carboxymuconolactone decarboxylase